MVWPTLARERCNRSDVRLAVNRQYDPRDKGITIKRDNNKGTTGCGLVLPLLIISPENVGARNLVGRVIYGDLAEWACYRAPQPSSSCQWPGNPTIPICLRSALAGDEL